MVGGSRKNFNEQVKRLAAPAAGYIKKVPISGSLGLFSSQFNGRPPFVYGPTAKGAQHVEREIHKATKHLFLEHTLLNSYVAGVAKKACQLAPGFTLRAWEFEHTLPFLNPAALHFTGPQRYTTDALRFIESPLAQFNFFEEIDLNSEPNRRENQPRQTDIWKKLHFYLEFDRRRNEELAGRKFRVLFYFPTLAHLRYVQQRIAEAGGNKGIFWSTLFEHVTFDDPLAYLRDPIWYRGVEKEPQALFMRRGW